jgi:hypothetical protein
MMRKQLLTIMGSNYESFVSKWFLPCLLRKISHSFAKRLDSDHFNIFY